MEILLNFLPIGAGSLKWGRLAGFLRRFHRYKSGSKKFYDPLRPIPTYTEGPQIFKKIVITLICMVYGEKYIHISSYRRFMLDEIV